MPDSQWDPLTGVSTFGQYTFRQLTFRQFTFRQPYIWSITKFGQLLYLVNCYQTSTVTFHLTTFDQLIQTHINLVNFDLVGLTVV